MPERDPTEIRQEMAVERRRLEEAHEGLRAELRSLVPIMVAGLVLFGLITARVGLRAGIRMIRNLS